MLETMLSLMSSIIYVLGVAIISYYPILIIAEIIYITKGIMKEKIMDVMAAIAVSLSFIFMSVLIITAIIALIKICREGL